MANVANFTRPGNPPPMDPDPLFSESRRFQRELAASAQISALAHLLANTHALYEGLPRPDPLTAEHQRVYTRAACLAVRFCADVQRTTARRLTQQLAVNTFDELKARLKSCDYTEAQVDEEIAAWVGGLLDTYLHHLAVGCGRSAAEHEFFNKAMADFEATFTQPSLVLPPHGTTGE